MARLPKYRVGNTDRIVGDPGPLEGFTVLNLSNMRSFKVVDGVWTALSTVPTIFSIIWTTTTSQFTYFVDPVNGNDSNTGRTKESAWLTTTKADAQELETGEIVGYLFKGKWILYRTVDLTIDLNDLPVDLITNGLIANYNFSSLSNNLVAWSEDFSNDVWDAVNGATKTGNDFVLSNSGSVQ
jgi:hypothetical protein